MNSKTFALATAIFLCCAGLAVGQSASVVDKTVDSIMQKVVQRDYEKAYSYVLFLAKIKGDEPLSESAITACEEAVDAYTHDLYSRREWNRLIEVGTELAGVPLSAQKKAEPRIAEAKSQLVKDETPVVVTAPQKLAKAPKAVKEVAKREEKPITPEVPQQTPAAIVIQDDRVSDTRGITGDVFKALVVIFVSMLLISGLIVFLVIRGFRSMQNVHRILQQNDDAELVLFVRTCEEIGKRVDVHTGRKNNSRNVARIVRDLSLSAGHSEAEAMMHYAIALARDAGLLFVDSCLFLSSSLDADAVALIRGHVSLASSIATFAGESFRDLLIQGIASHHENHDGSGYSLGIKGSKVPFVARAIRVAESYEAMVSPRPYHAIRDSRSAIAEIVDNPLVYDKRLALVLEDIV